MNGYINGTYFGSIQEYSVEYMSNWRFYCRFILIYRWCIHNIKSDNILLSLRSKSGEYKIPEGFMFKYVSFPNYLGEILEWMAFALMTWSLAEAIIYDLDHGQSCSKGQLKDINGITKSLSLIKKTEKQFFHLLFKIMNYKNLIHLNFILLISCEDNNDVVLENCSTDYTTSNILTNIDEEIFNNDESVQSYVYFHGREMVITEY